MKKKLVVVVAVTMLIGGCIREDSTPVREITTVPITKGMTTEESIEYNGLTRTYRLYIPSSYDHTPTPLVFVLHFGGGNAAIIEKVTEMTEKAEEEGFIVVYPNGTGTFEDRLLTWNAGFCCGYAVGNNIDDIRFINTLIETLKETLAVDTSRIYVTGFCNGGGLTHRIGAELSHTVAAIAPVAGSIGGKETEDSALWTISAPQNPVSVVIIHGTNDSYVPYDGGVTQGKGTYSILSVAESVSFWVDHNDCYFRERTINESGTVQVDTYSHENGTEVVLYTLTNCGHAWPGGKKFAGGDKPTLDISATDVIWEFFKNHPKTPVDSHIRTEFVNPVVTDPLITSLYEVPDSEERNLNHLIAVNTGIKLPGVLYVHLPGSGGLPEDYQSVTACAASCGYHVVTLAYPNWPAVRILIKGITDPDLLESIRQERLFGEDCTDAVDVSRADSIENRLIRLLQYNHQTHPDEEWDLYLTPDNKLKWDRIVVGGHSQGAGHAAYLAKVYDLTGIIMFAGPGDFITGSGPAPWLYYQNVTPPERMYAFTHKFDPVAQGFFMTQRILGLDACGLLQNVDENDELTSHMLTSTAYTDSLNYHSCIIADEYLSCDQDGTPVYESVWIYMFWSLLSAK